MSEGSGIIAVDVMGADLGVGEILRGIKLAVDELGNEQPEIILVGIEVEIRTWMKRCGLRGNPKISIRNATQVIEMGDKPISSMKQKRDSSMMVALDMVKAGEAESMLSCGNTGSLMAGATVKLRPMEGVFRPALSTIVPSKDHYFILLDAGANPDPDAKQLFHDAIFGSNHCKVELGQKNPTVGLLTIGTEEGKGTERIHEAHRLLKEIKGDVINYVGLIEGFHVFNEDLDVVVCDGFVGNILVKTCESLFIMLKDVAKEELTQNIWRKLGALITMGAYKSMRHKFNPERYGAAPLLGINGTVLKAHGSSNRFAIKSAMLTGAKIMKQDMNAKILEDVRRANEIIKGMEQEDEAPAAAL